MRILYACTQRPGYGGAATETYEAIKWLRKLGHEVCGVFIVPEADLDRCDPDGIGGIEPRLWTEVPSAPVPVSPAGSRKTIWHEVVRRVSKGEPAELVLREISSGSIALDPSSLPLPVIDWPRGAWDIAVGKNSLAPRLFGNLPAGVPRVYLTSGIEAFAANGFGSDLPADGPDRLAFAAAEHVIVHSTIDAAVYREKLTPAETAKIVPGIVRTSALAAQVPVGEAKPLIDRRWDLCLSSSTWKRATKGTGVAKGICFAMRAKLRIVVCGEAFDMPDVDCLGLVPHARMLDVIADSRIVAIPSLYDSSPNLYVEAALAGCNVVVSPRVGNIEGHPPGLLAQNPSAVQFVSAILRAMDQEEQLCYAVETPEGAARALSRCLEGIVQGGEKHGSP